MSASTKLSAASKTLISLAQALVLSGSHLEDSFWEQQLSLKIDQALKSKRKTIEKALDALLEEKSPAYEILAEYAESRSESISLSASNEQALLVCAPILTRTRYKLPSGNINKKQLQDLTQALSEHIFSNTAKVSVYPELVRFDRLPQSFQGTHELTQALAANASKGSRDFPELSSIEPIPELLADVFFIICTAVIPVGQPVFKWQTIDSDHHKLRETAKQSWSESCADILHATFAGCQNEYIIPDAYYTNTRKADQSIRPITLKAAISWLEVAAQIPSSELCAAIIGCGEQNVEEYRIGFTTKDRKTVIYGCIWPALNREEAMPDQVPDSQISPWDIIAAILRDAGVLDIRRIPGVQNTEFCDDCGAPYFPNMLGELQHPELPDEIEIEPIQFH